MYGSFKRNHSPFRSFTTVVVVALACLALPSSALSAAPANDDFSTAIAISGLPFSDSVDTTEATPAFDDPVCAGQGPTVWYAYTAAESVRITADTFGSSYDTTLSAFTGVRGSLFQIACNDDAQGLQSQVQFDVSAGVTYYFMVGAFGGGAGGQLAFHVAPVPPPPSGPANDEFAAATAIDSLPFEDRIDTSQATTADDDPFCSGRGATVWYAITPAGAQRIELNTFGSDYDTTLSVYTGAQGSLSQVACNDDTQGLQSRVRFAASEGVTYYVMVGSFANGPGGQLVFSAQEAPAALSVDVTVNPFGTVSPTQGTATVSGTVTSSRPVFVSLYNGQLKQRQGQIVLHGLFNSLVYADGTVPWTATMTAAERLSGRGNAMFHGGKSEVSLSAFAIDFDGGEQAENHVVAKVVLRSTR
jgi:hypothetical protein